MEAVRNARLVLPDQLVSGSLAFSDGVIARVDGGASTVGEDFEGDFLLPGLIELHTDHLETHYNPRANLRWNADAAVMAHDAQMAGSGVTTVFDALRVGMDYDAHLGRDDMEVLAQAVEAGARAGRLRADHFIHLRCEVSADDCLEGFDALAHHPLIRMASLMDHAPGQRQFAKIESYRAYYVEKLRMSEEVFRLYCERRVAESERNSAKNRVAIAERAAARGIVLASHDDATAAHVREAEGQGVRVAEFPTTREAAHLSREAGMAVLMGAPNLVRGSSHSGNVSARELAGINELDILSSDYVPYSILQSVFLLPEVVEGISLAESVRMATSNPARAVGLEDRGALAGGMRADFVRVGVQGGLPVVRGVWREGRRVA